SHADAPAPARGQRQDAHPPGPGAKLSQPGQPDSHDRAERASGHPSRPAALRRGEPASALTRRGCDVVGTLRVPSPSEKLRFSEAANCGRHTEGACYFKSAQPRLGSTQRAFSVATRGGKRPQAKQRKENAMRLDWATLTRHAVTRRAVLVLT